MKIMVVYIPRSKSTMVHDVLAKKFQVEPLKEILTFSRRLKQNYDEYPALIQQINSQDNISVKVCINDFIDTKNCCINDAYKDIDYSSFDHIVFIKRQDVMGNVASFGHHHLFDPTKWHRKKGQDFEGRQYQIELNRVFYILRAYRMFDEIFNWVKSNSGDANIYNYESETVEQALIKDFNLGASDFDIEIEPCGLDYEKLASNYQEIKDQLPDMYARVMAVNREDFKNPDSAFWENNVSFI